MTSSRVGKARGARERPRIWRQREHERPLNDHPLTGGNISRGEHGQLPIKGARGDAAGEVIALKDIICTYGKAIDVARTSGQGRIA